MGILEKDLLSYIESKSQKNINSAIDEYETCYSTDNNLFRIHVQMLCNMR